MSCDSGSDSDWAASVLKTMADVHPLYGQVTAHRLDPGSGRLVVQVSIPPAEDLMLPFSNPAQPLLLELYVPRGFPTTCTAEGGTVTICLNNSGRTHLALLQSLLLRREGRTEKDNGNLHGAYLVESGSSSLPLPQLAFSWLGADTDGGGGKLKYGLGVWVFAVRNLLLNPAYKPWYTPPPFLHTFVTSGPSVAADTRPLVLLSGAGAAKGRRPYMEDVHFDFPAVNVSSGQVCSVLGVLDGHGGVECSRFAVEELPTQIVSAMRSGLSSSQALFTSFKNTDEEFISSTSCKAGTTATVLLWNHASGIVNLANAGDSRAVLCRGGVAVDVARDMKATDSCEIARIGRAGGYVSNGRVNGSLAIARAIGDKSLKKGTNPVLTAEPEIVTFRFQVDDQFILMASDGLWDVMTSQAAIDMANEMMRSNDILCKLLTDDSRYKGLPDEVAEVSAELAKIGDFMAHNACNTLGSQDNITVMIIVVKRHQTESQKRDGFQYPADRRCPENQPYDRSSSADKDDDIQVRAPAAVGSSWDDRDDDRRVGERNPGMELAMQMERERFNSEDSGGGRHRSRSTTVEVSCSKKDSLDDDDEAMSFLLDDSNF